tara:strand:- start:107 stop:508 length:402 start_codon:yes stop_codon:yes gene_type:complete
MMKKMNCPCGRDKLYESCSSLVHRDINNAKTAEDLMRSRSVAFTKGDGDYLMKSHHSSIRPISGKEDIGKCRKLLIYICLGFFSSINGLVYNSEGTVGFKAYFKERGIKRVILENSRCIRQYGCWMYLGKVEE